MRLLLLIFTSTVMALGAVSSLSFGIGPRAEQGGANYFGSFVDKKTFSEDERDIAVRMCYALKSSRMRLLSEGKLQSFPFSHEERSCDQSSQVSQLHMRLLINDNRLSLMSSNTKKGTVSWEVENDETGYLRDICYAIYRGMNWPSPNKKVNSDNSMTIGFYSLPENRLGMEAVWYNRDGRLYRKQEMVIVADSLSSKHGMIVERIEKELCSRAPASMKISRWSLGQ